MTIDWITVSAQAVNFLILVWLLKRFLYQPVLRAMARREKHIDERLEEAEHREQEAQSTITDYQERINTFESQREERLSQAETEAEDHKHGLLEQARTEVTKIKEQWHKQAERERADFLTALRQAAATEFLAIARKILTDLANQTLEQQISNVFLEKFENLPEMERQKLENTSGTIYVRTAFELNADTRQHIKTALSKQLSKYTNVEFKQDQELIGGIELTAGGQSVAWSIDNYLEQLAARVETRLDAEAKEP